MQVHASYNGTLSGNDQGAKNAIFALSLTQELMLLGSGLVALYLASYRSVGMQLAAAALPPYVPTDKVDETGIQAAKPQPSFLRRRLNALYPVFFQLAPMLFFMFVVPRIRSQFVVDMCTFGFQGVCLHFGFRGLFVSANPKAAMAWTLGKDGKPIACVGIPDKPIGPHARRVISIGLTTLVCLSWYLGFNQAAAIALGVFIFSFHSDYNYFKMKNMALVSLIFGGIAIVAGLAAMGFMKVIPMFTGGSTKPKTGISPSPEAFGMFAVFPLMAPFMIFGMLIRATLHYEYSRSSISIPLKAHKPDDDDPNAPPLVVTAPLVPHIYAPLFWTGLAMFGLTCGAGIVVERALNLRPENSLIPFLTGCFFTAFTVPAGIAGAACLTGQYSDWIGYSDAAPSSAAVVDSVSHDADKKQMDDALHSSQETIADKVAL